MKNGELFSHAALLRATGGSWSGKETGVNGVFTDTRVQSPGALFAALAGERFDAHDFLDRAVAAGAAVLCVESAKAHLAPPGVPLLKVDDTLKAFQALGAFHRKRFENLTVFGVTGSVGKTSVKEMLRAICTAAAGGSDKVLWTAGNTNNQIGVPQNLLRLNSGHRFAVLEAGTNHFGEISPLSLAIAPDIALVNSVAPCHLEFLRDLEGVAEEKSHICDGMASSGTAVFPAELPQLPILEKAFQGEVIYFGRERGDVRSRYCGGNLYGSSFDLTFPDGTEKHIQWHLTGAHQALNAAAAAAAAYAAGITPDSIAAGLAETTLPGGRSRVYRSGDVTCIDDTYNANPAAMKAALCNLQEFADPENLLLLLGEMRELGDAAPEAHREIRELAVKLFPQAAILFVGSSFGDDALPDSAAAQIAVTEIIRPGMLIFAKGSRGVHLENALPEER